MSEGQKSIEFPSGMYVNPPTQGNKHFLFGKIDITRAELGNWLRGKHEDKIKIDILYSKTKVDDSGNAKLFLAVSDWKPTEKGVVSKAATPTMTQATDEFEDEIPF